MTLYLMNTLIVPIDFDKIEDVEVELRRIDAAKARQIIEEAEARGEKVVSAIGHEGAAKVLTAILGRTVPANRISVFMEAGDRGIHLFLKKRLPEGTVLTEEQMKGLEYWLVLSDIGICVFRITEGGEKG